MWLIAAALLLVLELITGWIATFCVGIGCLVASVMDIAGCSLQWQLAGVVVGVILAFIFLAPFVNRLRKSRAHAEAYNSNMDALSVERFLLRDPFRQMDWDVCVLMATVGRREALTANL